ncbi:reverse transcriptase-like protein, partial [candidate division WOR-3 bacterium]|nr:reverse transcriptase-like protein [candidate division WOR-3 bacterium]
VKHENMKPLYEKVMIIKRQFKKFAIMHIPRNENKAPDTVLNNILDEQIGKK